MRWLLTWTQMLDATLTASSPALTKTDKDGTHQAEDQTDVRLKTIAQQDGNLHLRLSESKLNGDGTKTATSSRLLSNNLVTKPSPELKLICKLSKPTSSLWPPASWLNPENDSLLGDATLPASKHAQLISKLTKLALIVNALTTPSISLSTQLCSNELWFLKKTLHFI